MQLFHLCVWQWTLEKKVVSNNRKYQNTTCKYLEMCTIKIDTAIELAEEKNNYC